MNYGKLPHSDRLIKAAVETRYLETKNMEESQVHALHTLSKIAASTGPKNLQRLVAEHRHHLIAGRADKHYEIPQFRADCETYVPVPENVIRRAYDYLMVGDADSVKAGRALWECLFPRED